MKNHILIVLCMFFTVTINAQSVSYRNRATSNFQKNIISAYQSYNAGVRAYKSKLYAESFVDMKMVITIHDSYDATQLEKFKNKKQFDTITAEANRIMADCKFYSGEYAEAIPLLKAAKNNPLTKYPEVYECLITAYKKQNDPVDANKMIREANNLFPDDTAIRNYELNYLINEDSHKDLIKQLVDASRKDPNNPKIHFNLAVALLKISSHQNGVKPLNAADLMQMSDEEFQKALKLSPDDIEYNYNLGAFYYNQATEFDNQMNDIPDSVSADQKQNDDNQKKYDDLKLKRDELFVKSLPCFEKACSLLLANKNNLLKNDKDKFKYSILALQNIYERQNRLEESEKMKAEYDKIQ